MKTTSDDPKAQLRIGCSTHSQLKLVWRNRKFVFRANDLGESQFPGIAYVKVDGVISLEMGQDTFVWPKIRQELRKRQSGKKKTFIPPRKVFFFFFRLFWRSLFMFVTCMHFYGWPNHDSNLKLIDAYASISKLEPFSRSTVGAWITFLVDCVATDDNRTVAHVTDVKRTTRYMQKKSQKETIFRRKTLNINAVQIVCVRERRRGREMMANGVAGASVYGIRKPSSAKVISHNLWLRQFANVKYPFRHIRIIVEMVARSDWNDSIQESETRAHRRT